MWLKCNIRGVKDLRLSCINHCNIYSKLPMYMCYVFVIQCNYYCIFFISLTSCISLCSFNHLFSTLIIFLIDFNNTLLFYFNNGLSKVQLLHKASLQNKHQKVLCNIRPYQNIKYRENKMIFNTSPGEMSLLQIAQ